MAYNCDAFRKQNWQNVHKKCDAMEFTCDLSTTMEQKYIQKFLIQKHV